MFGKVCVSCIAPAINEWLGAADTDPGAFVAQLDKEVPRGPKSEDQKPTRKRRNSASSSTCAMRKEEQWEPAGKNKEKTCPRDEDFLLMQGDDDDDDLSSDSTAFDDEVLVDSESNKSEDEQSLSDLDEQHSAVMKDHKTKQDKQEKTSTIKVDVIDVEDEMAFYNDTAIVVEEERQKIHPAVGGVLGSLICPRLATTKYENESEEKKSVRALDAPKKVCQRGQPTHEFHRARNEATHELSPAVRNGYPGRASTQKIVGRKD